MKFFVLNDQSERREGLKTLLRQIDRQAKFTEAENWRQVMHALSFGLPDLLVIDWQLHWLNGSDLLHLLHEHATLRVAILTDDIASKTIDELLHAGILGVIPRNLDPHLILRALELVLLGGHYVPACALDLALPNGERAANRRATYLAKKLPRRSPGGIARLSPRQHQIMRLVHMGNTNKMIARTLGISEGTVKVHLASVFKLLGATNRASAVALYNNWQFEKLQVLCSKAGVINSKPVPDMRSPVPLGSSSKAAPQVPVAVLAPENDPALLIAAQMSPTYLVAGGQKQKIVKASSDRK